MGRFDGKVAIVTGAGRGIGRSHARLLASEGAAVVVNDLGGSSGGDGADATPAQEVVDEITAKGGRAIANYDSVSSWDGARADGATGGRGARRARRAREQRRHPARQDELQHGRSRVGLGDRRAPEGPLRTVAIRRDLLAREVEGDRQPGEREDRQHRLGIRPVRQRRAGQLRGSQSGHRGDDHRDGQRARAHRRARQRHRPRRAHSPHRTGRG